MPTTAPTAPPRRRPPLRRRGRGGPPSNTRGPASRGPSGRATSARHHRAMGSLSLEMAMALPVVAVSAFALLSLVGVVRDALLAEDLARLGARIAATDPSDTTVARAVADAAGDGVTTEVTVDPSVRHHGDTVTVTVAVRRPGRRFDLTLTGRAAVHGEPLLDRPAGPAPVP